MSRKTATWLIIGIVLVLAIIVLYQQSMIRQRTQNVRSVRNDVTQEFYNDTTIDSTIDIVQEPTITANEVTGGVVSGATTTQSGSTAILSAGDVGCVTSYQALVDRAYSGGGDESDASEYLAQRVGLGYCNGSTPKESDFVSVTSNGQTISYSNDSGGVLAIDGRTVVPDFVQSCEGECPQVQAIRLIRPDNRYVVIETTKARDYQSSFRLLSTTNGVTMLFWSALNYVDPVVSYAWSDEGHFVFIASSGRQTRTYIVQPKGFPTNTPIAAEQDTPIAVSVVEDTVVVLYDRNPTNSDSGDRYTKTYNLDKLGQSVETNETSL